MLVLLLWQHANLRVFRGCLGKMLKHSDSVYLSSQTPKLPRLESPNMWRLYAFVKRPGSSSGAILSGHLKGGWKDENVGRNDLKCITSLERSNPSHSELMFSPRQTMTPYDVDPPLLKHHRLDLRTTSIKSHGGHMVYSMLAGEKTLCPSFGAKDSKLTNIFGQKNVKRLLSSWDGIVSWAIWDMRRSYTLLGVL